MHSSACHVYYELSSVFIHNILTISMKIFGSFFDVPRGVYSVGAIQNWGAHFFDFFETLFDRHEAFDGRSGSLGQHLWLDNSLCSLVWKCSSEKEQGARSLYEQWSTCRRGANDGGRNIRVRTFRSYWDTHTRLVYQRYSLTHSLTLVIDFKQKWVESWILSSIRCIPIATCFFEN